MEKDIALEQERNARYRPPKILEPTAFQEPPPKVSQAPNSLAPVPHESQQSGDPVQPLPDLTVQLPLQWWSDGPLRLLSPSTQPSISPEAAPISHLGRWNLRQPESRHLVGLLEQAVTLETFPSGDSSTFPFGVFRDKLDSLEGT